MSVTYAKRRNTLTGNDDANVRTIIDIYIINVNAVIDDQSTILSSNFADIPQVGDQHPTDSLVTVKRRSVDRSGNQLTWEMTVTYDNKSDSNDQGGGGGGGGQIIKVAITAWEEQFIMESDFKGNLIQNTAKDKLKLEMSRFHPQITITKVTQNPNLKVVKDVGGVNKAQVNWLGFSFSKDQLLFAAYNTDSIGNNTWNEQFVYKARLVPNLDSKTSSNEITKGWQAQILDAGFNQIINGGRTPIYVLNKDGKATTRPVSQPWPLNGGEALKPEDIENDRKFLEFQSQRRIGFGQFNFDFSPIFAPLPGRA